ncbi:uncharacterized protein LOC117323402 isoform X2 [Pecten maximus]|uniref:uncharacterized protein LOC117323402 isoform X2 n=1 Tax=Pecten maximus TaxID=6579 RepID=UPI001458AA8A|nr:uncharacterized protein LOC117323402 isoform X2 [Pecten maximus]
MKADQGFTITTYDPDADINRASYNPNTAFSGASYNPDQNFKNYVIAYDPNSLNDKYMAGAYNPHVNGVAPHTLNGAHDPHVNGMAPHTLNGAHDPHVNGMALPNLNGAHDPHTNGMAPHILNGVETAYYDPNKLTSSYLPNIFNPSQLNAKFTGTFDANSKSKIMMGDTGEHDVPQSESNGAPTVSTNWEGQWKGEWPNKQTSAISHAEGKDSTDGDSSKASWNGSWSKSWPGVPDSYGSIDQGNAEPSRSHTTNLHKANLEETTIFLQELLAALEARTAEVEF